MVEGQKVFLTPNPYDRNLFGLYIGEEQRMSNSCHKSSMLKIIKEWEQGHRRIEMFEDGGLLMKNYVGRKP